MVPHTRAHTHIHSYNVNYFTYAKSNNEYLCCAIMPICNVKFNTCTNFICSRAPFSVRLSFHFSLMVQSMIKIIRTAALSDYKISAAIFEVSYLSLNVKVVFVIAAFAMALALLIKLHTSCLYGILPIVGIEYYCC